MLVVERDRSLDDLDKQVKMHCTVLHYSVLYCSVLQCTVVYCTVLYCIVLYTLYRIILYCTVHITVSCILHNSLCISTTSLLPRLSSILQQLLSNVQLYHSYQDILQETRNWSN